MTDLKLNDIVSIPNLKTIGTIIDMGKDTNIWYRTDSDGVRERDELIRVKNVRELTDLINNGYKVAPSVMNKIVEKFVF